MADYPVEILGLRHRCLSRLPSARAGGASKVLMDGATLPSLQLEWPRGRLS